MTAAAPMAAGWPAVVSACALGLVLALSPIATPRAQAAAVVGNGQAATETRSIGQADAVETQSMDVTVRQGPQARVELRADANLLPLIETEVVRRGGQSVLVVRWRRNTSLRTRISPTAVVTLPRVQSLRVSGSGDLRAEGLQVDALEARVIGSGDVRLTGLQAGELSVRVTGSGDVSASGHAKTLKVRIEGSGDVSAEDLVAEVVTVSIAGSGDAAVHAQGSLAVSIAGSGDVVYRGQPQVSQSIAGSGSVTAR